MIAPMTPDDFRRLALSLPEATEGSHFGQLDFRITGKIFATLAHQKHGYGNLMLTPGQQADMIADAPAVFLPVHGGWGEKGATHVILAAIQEDRLRAALELAWKNKAPKRLREMA